MNATYTPLLQKRIDDLEQKDFDLEVWKSGTALLLTRIFGEANTYTKEVEALKVEHSSWALRDATAEFNPKETCKRSGRDILELALAELQLSIKQEKSINTISEILQNKSGNLETAIANKDEEAILALLNKENKEQLAKLLAKLLAK